MSEAGFEALRQEAARERALGGRLQRPRDAGTLIIVDHQSGEPRLLMGRRAASHVFMAGRYVFPGGRVDRADLTLAADFPAGPAAMDRLSARTGSRFDPRRASATALAAIRETFEEVGAKVGIAGEMKNVPGSWSAFADAGIKPDPQQLVPIGRAITPPGPPRRYDTRFFCVDGSAIGASLHFDDRPTDEFDTVDWFTFEEVKALSLARITRQILADLEARLADGTWLDPSRPMPFYRMVRGRFERDEI